MKSVLYLLIFTLAGLIPFHVYSQSDCKRDRVIGEWVYVTGHWGIHSNIDSMRQVASQAKDAKAVWNFRSDGTYVFESPSTVKTKPRPFSFDTIRCEIVLGKNKGKNRINLEIIYVDSLLLIYKADNNPKGYATDVLVRK